jgi:predicted Rossmann fold flavoprotein
VRKIVIVGGGAAGFFAAINAAENAKSNTVPVDIQILEASGGVLKKVAISGGGRCNVTHNLFDVRAFCGRYPRGAKELLSAFQRFQASDTIEWFRKRGIELVAEDDGRMFPVSNKSETIIKCFQEAATEAGVQVRMNQKVETITRREADSKFIVQIRNGETIEADSVMIATGSSPFGHKLAKDLGHTITELAPSLFSFVIKDPMIADIPGLSFENAETQLFVAGEKAFKEKGPMLITHWGLSGPAVLKISAWAAREMLRANYIAELKVNWLGIDRLDAVLELLRKIKNDSAKILVSNAHPEKLAKRFWFKVLEKSGISEGKRWAELSKKELQTLAEILFSTSFAVSGKNRYKDEFVECGGVDLKEIDFKKMESKICPGLFFAGEVLDIDGITGGFNFQNAWTGAWIASRNL